MRPARLAPLAAFFVTGLTLNLAGAEPTAPQRLPAPSPLRPEVAAYAAAQGIRTDGISAPAESATGAVGDAITAVITYFEGRQSRQWLTTFEIAASTDEERQRKYSSSSTFTVNGHVYTYSTTAGFPLAIRTAGPFLPGKRAPEGEEYARTVIGPEMLGLGLDRGVRALLPVMQTVAVNKRGGQAELPVMTAEDERAFGGLFVALTFFFNSVQATPGLRDILWDVVDKPSLWSIAKNLGIHAGLTFGDDLGPAETTGWARVEHALYRLPFMLNLNGTPALDCTLFVTTPKPPLLTSAGIVGMLAHTPGKPDRKLEIRVIAAYRASGAPAGP